MRDPQRRQALAQITSRRGAGVILDRSIYYAPSKQLRHPHPEDRGDVWVGGDKRVLVRVSWRDGELVHIIRGSAPPPGTKLNCHLDAGRRDDAAQTHAAMHVVASLICRRRLAAFTGDLSVLGGRQFHLALRWPGFTPQALKQLLDAANESLEKVHEVSSEFVPSESLRDVDTQPFTEPLHMPPVVRLIRIGDVSVLPCDAPVPTRTHGVGRITASTVQSNREQVRVRFRVARL